MARTFAKARYPLAKKQKAFVHSVVEMVGSQGWQGRLSSLWHRYQEEFSNKTEATQKLYISKFRNSVREAFKDFADEDPKKDLLEKVITYIAFPEGLNERLYANYQTTVKDRSRNLTVVRDYKALVALFRDLLEDESVRVKALAIMLLTGRRFFEVMTTADFKPVYQDRDRGRVRHKYLLEFSGQAKTREAEGTKYGESYRIPTLAPADDVLAALDIIRHSPEGRRWRTLSSGEMNAAESGRMNQMLRGVLAAERINEPELMKEFTIKKMRAVYAEIVYEVFAPKTFSKAAYFSQILGHGVDDIKTALSYMVFVLGDDKDNLAKTQREIQSLMEESAQADAAYRKQSLEPVKDGDVIDDEDK